MSVLTRNWRVKKVFIGEVILKDEYVVGNVGRTNVAGEEPACAHAWQCEGLGYFRRRPDRMLGIWASFMVLPLTHYILFSRSHWGPAFSSS